jgi:hypothetical protein
MRPGLGLKSNDSITGFNQSGDEAVVLVKQRRLRRRVQNLYERDQNQDGYDRCTYGDQSHPTG